MWISGTSLFHDNTVAQLLDALHGETDQFVEQLKTNSALHQALIEGLKNESSTDTTWKPRRRSTMANEAHKVCRWTGVESRATDCSCRPDFFPLLAEKQWVLNESMTEFYIALCLLKVWGTQDCREMFDEMTYLVERANKPMHLAGLDEDRNLIKPP